MKVYKIKVNGKLYEVEVEVEERDGKIVHDKQETSNTPHKNVDNLHKGETIKAPMQGNILSLKVSKGDRVSKGDVLLILEAMKMENEILSPTDGIISDVLVSEGKSVNNEDVMFIIS